MNGGTIHELLVQWGPTMVIGVAAIAVASAIGAFGVLVVTHLLGPKEPPADHGHHGHGQH